MQFGFVAKHRAIWPVELMCEALGISRSGFYGWLIRAPSARTQSDTVLGQAVRASCLASDRIYEARRVWRDVRAAGHACGLHRIERLMRVQVQARPKRHRRPVDTGDWRVGVRAPNVLDRQFVASASNQKWVADFTFVWTAEGWLYVAVVLDLDARRVVGWSIMPR